MLSAGDERLDLLNKRFPSQHEDVMDSLDTRRVRPKRTFRPPPPRIFGPDEGYSQETPIYIEVSKPALSASNPRLPVRSSPDPHDQPPSRRGTAVQHRNAKRVSKGKIIHGQRLRGKDTTGSRSFQSNDLRDSRLKCPVCLTHDVNCVTPCGHAYCRGCWDSWARLSDECGHCRQIVDMIRPLHL